MRAMGLRMCLLVCGTAFVDAQALVNEDPALARAKIDLTAGLNAGEAPVGTKPVLRDPKAAVLRAPKATKGLFSNPKAANDVWSKRVSKSNFAAIQEVEKSRALVKGLQRENTAMRSSIPKAPKKITSIQDRLAAEKAKAVNAEHVLAKDPALSKVLKHEVCVPPFHTDYTHQLQSHRCINSMHQFWSRWTAAWAPRWASTMACYAAHALWKA